MSDVTIKVLSPVDALDVQEYLKTVPTLPAIDSVKCDRLDVTVAFTDIVDGPTVALLQQIAVTLPLEVAKLIFKRKMWKDVNKIVTSGFTSNATGTDLWYDSNLEAQLNYTAIVTSSVMKILGMMKDVINMSPDIDLSMFPQFPGLDNDNVYISAAVAPGGNKQTVIHTGEQAIAVAVTLMTIKADRITFFHIEEAKVSAITTFDGLSLYKNSWDPAAPIVAP